MSVPNKYNNICEFLQCETMLENYESDIEEWYFKHLGSIPLKNYLCKDRILLGSETRCLDESLKPKGEHNEL